MENMTMAPMQVAIFALDLKSPKNESTEAWMD